jgi:glycosyltransferase involved in cell wall biosynthesis
VAVIVLNKRVSSNKRLKIYWLLGKSDVVRRVSGDRISEFNIVKALSQVADVYYNNKLYAGENTLGKSGIESPGLDYDLYYIRNNASISRMVPKGKLIYFATPFNEHAFESAACLTTYTDSWTRKLYEGWDFGSLYPQGFTGGVKNKDIKTIRQVIDPVFYVNSRERTSEIRKEIGGGPIIGLFGRVAKSCFPQILLDSIPQLIKEFPHIKILFAVNDKGKASVEGRLRPLGGASNLVGREELMKHIVFKRFEYTDVPSAISACDATFYSYIDRQGHFAGSMKILESMARGVPVLAPKYDARVDELGHDYPLFFENSETSSQSSNAKTEGDSERFRALFIEKVRLALDKQFSAEIGPKIKERSLKYNLDNSAKSLEKTFWEIYKKANK